MPALRRHAVLLPVAIALAIATATAAPDRTPKLIVLLVVDQFRGDYIDRYQSQWSLGLKQLVTEGAWFRRADYPYANTVTCAGHSSISTGASPSVHGMILNSWWDRALGREVTCTEDQTVTNLGYGKPASGGDSLVRLESETLADALRSQLAPRGRSVAFSLKARAALTLGGHHPDAVAWFDRGEWVTSGAMTTNVVPEVQDFITRNPVESDLGKIWDRSLPKARYLFEDPAVGVTAPAGMTATFPHRLSDGSPTPDAGFYDRWQSSPFSDDYLARMALDVAGHLHFEQGATNLLAISFSALDKVGHDYGPNSHEIQDVLIRLDRTLGTLFAGLDRLVGPGNYTVALSADHGVAPIPERAIAEGQQAGRVPADSVVTAVEACLSRAFGEGRYVSAFVHSDVYLEPGVADRLRANPTILASLRSALQAVPGVAAIVTPDQLRAPLGTIEGRVSKSFAPTRSGDLVVLYRPYWIDADTGTSHGTPYGYDTHVPVLLMGKGVAAAEYLSPAMLLDIAPTLAFLSGVTLANAEGRVSTQALTTTGRPVAHAGSQR